MEQWGDWIAPEGSDIFTVINDLIARRGVPPPEPITAPRNVGEREESVPAVPRASTAEALEAHAAATRAAIALSLDKLNQDLKAIEESRNAATERIAAEPWLPIEPACLQLGYWVTLTQTRLVKTQARLLKRHGIIPSELAVLRQLYGPQRRSIVELGQAIGMSKGGVSKLVDRLVSKGLVQKEVSEYDRRWQPVTLTPEGKRLVPMCIADEEGVDRQFFAQLTPRRRQSVMKSLEDGLSPPQRYNMELWLSDPTGTAAR